MNPGGLFTRLARFLPAFITLLACAAIGVAAWTATQGRAFAALVQSGPTATAPAPWSHVVVAKPSYTPPPTLPASPTPTSTLEPTHTPGAMLAQIVADTPTAEPPKPSAAILASGSGKYILVDISDQHLYAYSGSELTYSFVASTGLHNATARGVFSVLSKIPNAYGATWDIWMPNWLGIYWAGGLQNGIHALPILPSGARLWAGYLGSPVSYGCVVLGVEESQLLYDWAELGTPVEIQW